MKIIWNVAECSFDLQFAQGDLWKNDLECAKAAGFKTTGPPNWIWYTTKLKVLKSLQANRPQSDIIITSDAREHYEMLQKQAAIKAGILKQYETAKAIQEGKLTPDEKTPKKSPKKRKEKRAIGGNHFKIDYVLKPYIAYVPPPPPDLLCIFCRDPVYYYERQDPPVCLWCDKTILK